MKFKIKGLVAALGLTVTIGAITACSTDAEVASHNVKKAADNFEVMRRVVFYNALQDKVVLVTEGRCSVAPANLRTAVTCKTGPNEFKIHYYGRSDNTVYFVEQMESTEASVYHYRRTFKPQTAIPDIDFRYSSKQD